MQFSKITACGRSYHKQFAGYVCINEMGDLIKPHYVTEQFPKLLDANGLRRIRFHDLRHSCASRMLANGVPMKQIQDWLGHSDGKHLCPSRLQHKAVLGRCHAFRTWISDGKGVAFSLLFSLQKPGTPCCTRRFQH